MSESKDTYLTPGQVSKLLMVSPASVRLWAEKGALHAVTTPGGHRRFSNDEVSRFAAERGITFDDAGQKKLSILIVDDDAQFSAYLKALLNKYPEQLSVAVAEDGFDAGIKVRDLKVDVVLLDLMMPTIDGFSVCERVKGDADAPPIRVIAMTGHPSAENVERILSAGAEICLSKPIDRSELLNLLGVGKA